MHIAPLDERFISIKPNAHQKQRTTLNTETPLEKVEKLSEYRRTEMAYFSLAVFMTFA
jgi:hypothetical protein